MHELALCQAIAETVASHTGAATVRAVEVRIGHLRQVVPDALQFSWRLTVAGTALADAELLIDHVPVELGCRTCSVRSQPRDVAIVCSACGSDDVRIERGEEFLVVGVDVDRGSTFVAPSPTNREPASMESITLTPIAVVRGGRDQPVDDDWGEVTSQIVLDDRFGADSLAGLDTFSHVEVVFVFDRVDEAKITTSARHPRNNPDWPEVGIFAQRAKGRPNRIGLTTCEVVSVDGRVLTVRGLDAIDGTPVLDLKPYMVEFAPRVVTHQPAWSSELMAGYW